MLVIKLVQGEEKLNDLIRRMKGPTAKVQWCETTGRCDEIMVWLFYMRKDGEYRSFYMLGMTHPKGQFPGMSTAQDACFIRVEGEETQVANLMQIRKNCPEKFAELVRLSKLVSYDEV